MNEFMTEVFVEQPMALPGSAKKLDFGEVTLLKTNKFSRFFFYCRASEGLIKTTRLYSFRKRWILNMHFRLLDPFQSRQEIKKQSQRMTSFHWLIPLGRVSHTGIFHKCGANNLLYHSIKIKKKILIWYHGSCPKCRNWTFGKYFEIPSTLHCLEIEASAQTKETMMALLNRVLKIRMDFWSTGLVQWSTIS